MPNTAHQAGEKAHPEASGIRCPACGSDAFNRYGRVRSGKQRYCCLVCGRQFVEPGARRPMENRPNCPACGAHMHVYARNGNLVRFRCSNYPDCKTFLKREEEVNQ